LAYDSIISISDFIIILAQVSEGEQEKSHESRRMFPLNREHRHDPEESAVALSLACIIHESLRFVNKHPQQIENLCCGFRQGASYLVLRQARNKLKIFVAGFDRVLRTSSFDKLRIPSEIEGLKASPEWRPEKAVVEVSRQAREIVHAANRDS
jgi:hypothetical protein